MSWAVAVAGVVAILAAGLATYAETGSRLERKALIVSAWFFGLTFLMICREALERFAQ